VLLTWGIVVLSNHDDVREVVEVRPVGSGDISRFVALLQKKHRPNSITLTLLAPVGKTGAAWSREQAFPLHIAALASQR
jgi:hypothetical protein